MRTLALDVADGDYALVRLPADAAVPAGLLDRAGPGLVSVTRTAGELSIVCPAALVPDGAESEAGWRALIVRGPMAFTLTGIIAALASELAAAGVALFSLSTFDTDHVLVQDTDLARAVQALRAAGHEVHGA